MANKTLLLIDGSYYLFRAYFATQAQRQGQDRQRMMNSQGEPTGAIFGVVNTLAKVKNEFNPDYLAVVFDARGKSFRNDLYPEYKANRPPAPEDLVYQIPSVHEIIRAQGIPLLIIDDVEADDVIATLALEAKSHGIDTIISSGDKDLAQIVSDHVRIINPMNDAVWDRQGVIEKFGVPPERIVDYLALVGDSSDNVPGIPKVGPKTAVKWLNEYGSLESVVENAGEIKGKVGENLRSNLEQLSLSRVLVTLKTDVELDLTPEKLKQQQQDMDTLVEQYKRWEFRSLLSKLGQGVTDVSETGPTEEKVQDINYETVLTKTVLDRWLKDLNKVELFAVDTETTSLDYMEARIVGLSFSIKPGEAAYVPLCHDYPGSPDQLEQEYVLDRIKPLLESEKVKKLGHNLKYDMSIFANHGIRLRGIEHDTMLESYVLDSTATRHDMDSLAKKYLDHETIHYEDIAGKGAKQITFNEIPIEIAAPYAAEDADVTLQLHLHLWPLLKKLPGLKQVYQDIEVPLLQVLSGMERNGVMVDPDALHLQSMELTQEMERLEQNAHEIAGQSFNISSPKQIQSILYEKMNLPVLAKTPKGQPSTAESVLQELAQDYELPGVILEYRSVSKLKSTYTDKLPLLINPSTGRIHASFHQAVASTGRLSSSDPNLQNIPIRTAAGRKIRQAFIAKPGYKILAADYSQIELRIMAHLSGDDGLLAAFNNNEDVHRRTAAEVFSVDSGSVTDEQRRAAKAINFGLIYGMSAFGLSRQLGIGRSEAKEYVDRYFTRYPGVREFMDRTRESARENGYVETVFKRRLYLPEINSRNAPQRQYAERTAINAPMQGTAADIIKRAMINIDRQFSGDAGAVQMIMQVHDELVFEVTGNSLEHAKDKIQQLMESAADLSVPLVVDLGTGDNWDEAH